MDDLRVLWMRDRVYAALGLTDPQLFEELLSRDDGDGEDLILHFLNRTSDEEGASTLCFFRTAAPEEVLVEAGEPAAGGRRRGRGRRVCAGGGRRPLSRVPRSCPRAIIAK